MDVKAVKDHFGTVLLGSESLSINSSFDIFLTFGVTVIDTSVLFPYNHICVILSFKIQMRNGIKSNGMMKIRNLVLLSASKLIQRILADKSKINHIGENVFWEFEVSICLNGRMDYDLIFP